MIHAWWNITYLRPHGMNSMKPALEEPRPWVDDDRLQDPFDTVDTCCVGDSEGSQARVH